MFCEPQAYEIKNLFFFSEYPYKFVKVLKHQQLIEKETLTLLCELDDAAGEVKWFKGDQAITPDKRYSSQYKNSLDTR